MEKIKILYVHHGSGIGGAPISLLNLIKRLDKSKFSIKVLFVTNSVIIDLFNNNCIENSIINGSNDWFVHNETGKYSWFNFLKYFKIYLSWKKVAFNEAPNFLKLEDFDILHLNSHVLTSWAFAGKLLNKRVVLHNREAIANGFFGLRKKILANLIMENCNAVINISYDNFHRLGLKNDSHVIYNFVQIPDSYINPFNSKEIKVLFLGGSARIKGFSVAVDSLQYLNDNIKIQFAGSLNSWNKPKSFKERLKNLLKLTVYRSSYLPIIKLSNAKNAEILGLLKDPYPYIDECDILITPFTVEHFSRPAMEAFAYGKPVIGSDVEGMNEIIDHGINGLLFEKNNPKKLAEAINYLAMNPEFGRKLGENGRKKAEVVYSPEVNTGKVEEIYLRLMQRVN